MHEVIKECIIDLNINEVWDLVTDLNNQLWRRDISHIDIIDESVFIEHDRQGYETRFMIRKKIENQI